jgi:hypothetical protein
MGRKELLGQRRHGTGTPTTVPNQRTGEKNVFDYIKVFYNRQRQ